MVLCYTERPTKAWHRQATKKTGNTYSQHKRPQSVQLTDQALGTIGKAAHESSRITPTSTAALHVSSTATPTQHHTGATA